MSFVNGAASNSGLILFLACTGFYSALQGIYLAYKTASPLPLSRNDSSILSVPLESYSFYSYTNEVFRMFYLGL